jgi:hypothetical protein
MLSGLGQSGWSKTMTRSLVLQVLEESKIHHRFNDTFDGMLRHTGKLGRINCAELLSPEGFLTGISFWLHEGQNDWYLGLWSSRLYRCGEPEKLIELCKDLLSGKYVPSGETPAEMPVILLDKYKLTDVTRDMA